MLNRKGGLVGTTPVGFSRATNEGLFIRRVAAFAEDIKQPPLEDALSPDWSSPDSIVRAGGNLITWSADSLNAQYRDASSLTFVHLDSPKSSFVGSPTLCTGGGHGEAGPTSPDGSMQMGNGSDSSYYMHSIASPTRKAAPLARHLAERSLQNRAVRRSMDVQSSSQLRTRDCAPAFSSSSPVPSSAVSTITPSSPSCSTIEKLPSFMRTSSTWTNSVPETPPFTTPNAPRPSDSSLPSMSHNSSSNFSSSHSNGSSVPWVTARDSLTSTSSRALTPTSGSTTSRQTRHVNIMGGGRHQQRPPPLSAFSGGDGQLDKSPAPMRVRASTGLGTTTTTASPPPFSPRLTPPVGLIHLWSGAPAAMRRTDWSLSHYAVSRQLYGGYASSVFKARCLRSGMDVVLKVYTISTLSDFLRNQVLRELDIHARLENPCVVQMLAAFREGDKLVLLLEYVRGGSLDRARRKLGGRMNEQQALDLVLVPLLRTLHYLHSKSIVHRDIKPENILFTPDWKLKLCDYGVSICLLEERAVTRTGSRDYMAPEVQVCPLKRAPDDNKGNLQLAYSAAVDIWSLGVLTYELLVGFTPFPGGPPPIEDKMVGVACTRAPAFPSCVSADARAFVSSCLADIAGDRPTIFELMKHRWIQNALVRPDRF